MTYCAGILVREGLVMIADTRTNAGLDNISTFRKLHVFERPGERVVAIATAGNLSVSQSVVSFLHEGVENRETGRSRDTARRADHVPRGAAGRPRRPQGPSHRRQELDEAGVKFDVSILLGGQIQGGAPRLFMLYAAGQLHRVRARDALSPDRRAQIREAHPRPRRDVQHDL